MWHHSQNPDERRCLKTVSNLLGLTAGILGLTVKSPTLGPGLPQPSFMTSTAGETPLEGNLAPLVDTRLIPMVGRCHSAPPAF